MRAQQARAPQLRDRPPQAGPSRGQGCRQHDDDARGPMQQADVMAKSRRESLHTALKSGGQCRLIVGSGRGKCLPAGDPVVYSNPSPSNRAVCQNPVLVV